MLASRLVCEALWCPKLTITVAHIIRPTTSTGERDIREVRKPEQQSGTEVGPSPMMRVTGAICIKYTHWMGTSGFEMAGVRLRHPVSLL